MMYRFDLIQKRRIQRGEAAKRKSSYPLGSERAASLLRSLEPVLNETGYVLDGFTAALKELTEFADLRRSDSPIKNLAEAKPELVEPLEPFYVHQDGHQFLIVLPSDRYRTEETGSHS
jgi:hypothetical protein